VVALAGPFSNLIMAVILALLAVLTLTRVPVLAQFLAHGVELSLYLALINMLPIPPLDGSKLLLAARIPTVVYMELGRFGFMLLIVLVSVTRLGVLMNEWSYLGTRAIFSVLRVAG
jgi:Zn-dependent protease